MSETPPPMPAPAGPEPAPKAPGAPQGIGPPWLRGVFAVPYAVLFQIVIAVLLFGAATLLSMSPDSSSSESLMLFGAGTYLFVIPGIWLAWWAFGRASLADMGHAGPAPRALLEIMIGMIAGVVLLALIVGFGVTIGAYTVELADWRTGLRAQAVWLPVLFVAAYYEELLLRGWVMQDLGRHSPLRGLLISSVIFAILHGANPGVFGEGTVGALVILANIFLAGMVLGAIFLLSGRLWLPTGAHLGWNWATAVLFGLPVSGFRLPSFLESEAVEGSGLLSGGAFGPEGSTPSLGILLLAALALTLVALKRRLPVAIVARHAPQTHEGDMILESGPATDETT